MPAVDSSAYVRRAVARRGGDYFLPSMVHTMRYNDDMSKKPPTPARYVQPYRYPSPNIPMSAIRRYVREIAERFTPEKIILFGSYAYGTPHEESDVDLMVIMRTRDMIDQAIRIDNAIERLFSVDVHVRTPYQIKIGLKEGDTDWFLFEVMTKGKVLYEAPDGEVGGEGRGGHNRRKVAGGEEAGTKKRGGVPLPTGRGKIPESPPPEPRRRRAQNA
jgi:predicted nucleotidyltransferase